MSAPSLSNVFSDVYITGNCAVKGTISSLAGSITSQWTTGGSTIYYTAGNVGIGTNNPTGSGGAGSLLHVYDATSANPTVHVDASGGTGQARLHLRAGAGATNRASRIDFFNNVTSSTVPQWTIISGYDQNGTNDMRYVNYAGAITMAWAQNGNIGIGTTNPGSLLTVSGGVGIGSGYNAFTAPTGGLIVQGNVGIGTATPQSPLHVNAAVGGNGLTIGPDTPYVTSGSMFGLAIINSTLTSGQSSVIQIGRAGTDTMFISHNYTGASASSYLAFAGYGYSTQGSLCIRNDGKVGIGTSNPGCALSFGQPVVNKIITLYDSNPADPVSTATDFYGFGINGGILRYQAPTGASHRFYCSTTLAATISSTGINVPGVITNPGRPLSLVGKNNGDVSVASIMVFNAVGYNVGSMYNSSNGRWTASVAGYYQFTYSGLSRINTPYPNMRWFINGNDFGWGACHFNVGNITAPNHLQLSCSVIISMAVNDFVQFYVATDGFLGSSTIHNTACCIFLG